MLPSTKLALGWTPNTNHTGIYVARAKGHYDDADVDLSIHSPAEDDDETTPAKRVVTGEATIAIVPSESAITAVCQRDTSAIVALASIGINRQKKLDTKTYASYGARFEDRTVRQLVRNGGGEGDVEIVTPRKLGTPNTLLDGTADATWVFVPWEGVQTERDVIDLNAFSLDATRRGYEFAADGPGLDDESFLVESQRRITPAYLSEDEWGGMRHERWAGFVAWLADEEFVQTTDGDYVSADEIDVGALYTNALLGGTDRNG